MAYKKQGTFTKWVNSLTDEQMARIYQHIDPISDEERRELENLDVLREELKDIG